MSRSNISVRYHSLLTVVVEAARDHLDEWEASPRDEADVYEAALRLTAALDDLDAHCDRCDDAGVIVRTRTVSTAYVGPPIDDEVPCECEASRVIAAKRADRQRRTGT